MRPADWDALKALASHISRVNGRSVTPSQVAGHLLSSCLRDLPIPTDEPVKPRR